MHAVIMAGGSGTRFWPASRRLRPKQLMDFWGEPLIRRTMKNLAGVIAPGQQWVVTGQSLLAGIAAAVPEIPARQLIAEPVGRNTAPCVGLAAMLLEREHGETVFGLFASDHGIRDREGWEACLRAGFEEAARNDVIVTLGVRPSHPETGYGYIEIDPAEQSTTGLSPLRVARFVEKPDRATAQRYLDSGRFLWNAGIFFCRTSTMLGEIARQMPELFAGLQELGAAWGTERFDAAMAAIYPKLPSTSIDYGVMEHARAVRVVPASFGWSDLGHWAALEDELPPDAHGNVANAGTLLLDCERSVIINAGASTKKVVALGVSELVLVDTPDALLVCPRDRVQEVRRVVEALQREGRDDLL